MNILLDGTIYVMAAHGLCLWLLIRKKTPAKCSGYDAQARGADCVTGGCL
jgi:hypothetical protein